MRVNGTGRSGGVSSTSSSKSAGSSGAVFRPEIAEEAAPAAQPRSVPALGGVDALLAIQAAGEHGGDKRRRAIKRGTDILDMLDEVKLDLLGGRVSQVKLRRLLEMIQSGQAAADDPRLAGIMAEIDLRARVELAKLGVDGA